MISVQDARDGLERLFDDDLEELGDATFLDWINELNQLLYDKQVGVDPNGYWLETSFSANKNTIALPTDFYHTRTTVTGFFNSSEEPYTGVTITGRERSRSATFTTEEVVTLKYIPLLTRFTAVDTSELVISERNFQLVVDFLDSEYGRWNEDITKELNANSRFSNLLTTLLRNESPEPLVYTLQ